MTCNEVLRREGKRYPRTCAECRLGPCTYKLEVKIKPLVWGDGRAAGCNYKAMTSIGSFQVTRGPMSGWWIATVEYTTSSRHATASEAKAWCQAEYERRVRECLE